MICRPCAQSKQACEKCLQPFTVAEAERTEETVESIEETLEEALESVDESEGAEDLDGSESDTGSLLEESE